MGSIQYWQLATDAFLVASLFYLALRFTRSSSGQLELRSQELQAGLRTLIREADKAGQSLNDTLINRRSELESLLNNLQASESKIGRFENESERHRAELNDRIDCAQKMIQSLEDALNLADARYNLQDQRTSRSRMAREEENPLASITQSVPNPTPTYAPEPPSFRERSEKQQPVSNEATKHAESAPAVNIYGEPIGDHNERPTTSASRLEQFVEKEQVPNQPSSLAAANQPIETIYDAAEKLLKAGYDLQAVSDKTRLPLEDVRMLSQIVVDTPGPDYDDLPAEPEIIRSKHADDTEEYVRKSPVFDPQEVETKRADQRLGVLGTMRREKYTV